MPSVSLTPKYIEHAAATDKRQEIADAALTGHYLIIQPSGAKSFAVRYRLNGKTVKQTIGSCSKVTLAKAREEATRIIRAVDEGTDPQEEAKVANADFLIKNHFEDFLKRYVEKENAPNVAKRRRKIAETEIIPAWGERYVWDIRKRDVVKFLDGIIDRGAPVQANRTFSFLKKYFNWSVARDVMDHSPMDRMDEPSKEQDRERKLSDDELLLVWNAAEADGYPFGPAVQLLILTAQRRQEVGGARRREFGGAVEFGSNMPIWIIPKERTKNRKSEHVVPLTEMADNLFRSLPIIAGPLDYCFTNFGKRASTGWSHAKERIDARIAEALAKRAEETGEPLQTMEPWTFHDLRRTATTGMARLKVLPHVTEAILNHKRGTVSGVAKTYNRYEYFDEKVEALLAWEAHVKRVISGATNVVPLFQQAAG
jgi:integrase